MLFECYSNDILFIGQTALLSLLFASKFRDTELDIQKFPKWTVLEGEIYISVSVQKEVCWVALSAEFFIWQSHSLLNLWHKDSVGKLLREITAELIDWWQILNQDFKVKSLNYLKSFLKSVEEVSRFTRNV